MVIYKAYISDVFTEYTTKNGTIATFATVPFLTKTTNLDYLDFGRVFL